MSKEKQIEEMAKDMCSCCKEAVSQECEYSICEGVRKHAEALYNAGYRKQNEDVTDINVGNKSEWISVDERLPTVEENDRGLVGIVNGHNGKIGFKDAIVFVDYDFDEKEWWSEDFDLTNCKVDLWFSIPKPPKMKGGAK